MTILALQERHNIEISKTENEYKVQIDQKLFSYARELSQLIIIEERGRSMNYCSALLVPCREEV